MARPNVHILLGIFILTCLLLFNKATPIVEYPMIATHNSATSYLSDGLVNRWVKCQSKTVYDQLLCGVRFLFLSVTVVGDKLMLSHGTVIIPKPFDEVVDEIMRFSKHYPESFVFVDISKCYGANCMDMVRLRVHGRAGQWVGASSGCFPNQISYQELRQSSKIPSGGSIVFVEDKCVRENWIPDIECYGEENSDELSGKYHSTPTTLLNRDYDPNNVSGADVAKITGTMFMDKTKRAVNQIGNIVQGLFRRPGVTGERDLATFREHGHFQTMQHDSGTSPSSQTQSGYGGGPSISSASSTGSDSHPSSATTSCHAGSSTLPRAQSNNVEQSAPPTADLETMLRDAILIVLSVSQNHPNSSTVLDPSRSAESHAAHLNSILSPHHSEFQRQDYQHQRSIWLKGNPFLANTDYIPGASSSSTTLIEILLRYAYITISRINQHWEDTLHTLQQHPQTHFCQSFFHQPQQCDANTFTTNSAPPASSSSSSSSSSPDPVICQQQYIDYISGQFHQLTGEMKQMVNDAVAQYIETMAHIGDNTHSSSNQEVVDELGATIHAIETNFQTFLSQLEILFHSIYVTLPSTEVESPSTAETTTNGVPPMDSSSTSSFNPLSTPLDALGQSSIPPHVLDARVVIPLKSDDSKPLSSRQRALEAIYQVRRNQLLIVQEQLVKRIAMLLKMQLEGSQPTSTHPSQPTVAPRAISVLRQHTQSSSPIGVTLNQLQQIGFELHYINVQRLVTPPRTAMVPGGLPEEALSSTSSSTSTLPDASQSTGTFAKNKRIFVCYEPDTQHTPWRRLDTYLMTQHEWFNQTKQGLSTLFTFQAHWQYSALSIAIGVLKNSSILLDHRRSMVNKEMVQRIVNGLYPSITILQLDDVCYHEAEQYKGPNELKSLSITYPFFQQGESSGFGTRSSSTQQQGDLAYDSDVNDFQVLTDYWLLSRNLYR